MSSLKTKLAELLQHDDDICREGAWRELAQQQQVLIEVLVEKHKEIATGRNAQGEKVDFADSIAMEALQKAKEAGYL
jgi:hypothetical protein